MAVAAVALAGPQEALAVLEEFDVAFEIDPVGVGFLEDGGGLAALGVDGDHLQFVLHAIHAQDVHRARVGHPAGARDQVGVAGVADLEPLAWRRRWRG